MNQQGVQRLTTTDRKIYKLLQKESISEQDVRKALKPSEEKRLGEIIGQKIKNLSGNEREKFIEKVQAIQSEDFRNQTWERNHYMIVAFINNYIAENGMLPTKNNIHVGTQISRQTINKHLKEYSSSQQYKDRQNSFKIISDKMLTKVIEMALSKQGDVKAARLYFEVMGFLGGQSNGTKIDTQNNYIQINQVKLNQDIINELPPDQRAKIEEILAPSLKTIKAQAQN